MRSVKVLLCASLFMGLLGWALMSVSEPTVAAGKVDGAHWRYHDGHWSYWHEGDRRWYYTDGTHWYYHNGLSWVLYPFDRLFGRDFHHGDYKVPPHDKVVVPHHGVFR